MENLVGCALHDVKWEYLMAAGVKTNSSRLEVTFPSRSHE